MTAATISLQDKRYEDPEKVNRLFEDTLAGIRRQPGVEAAGVALGLPYTRLLNLGFGRVEGATAEDKGGNTNLSYITPGYVEALRLPIRKGRAFTDADRADSPAVAIVNEQFVQRYYKGQDVVGLHIRVAGGPREIVGVVANARATSSGLGGDGSPLITPYVVYVPATQTSGALFKLVHTWFSPSWVVRSSGPIAGLTDGVRQSVAAVDPMLPIARMESMADVQSASLARQRFMMTLVVGLGAVALLLAAIGIHGLISGSVSERTRELGIRLALGATGRQVVKDVVMPGIMLAGVGVALGSAASVAVVRLLQSFLWGVTPTDSLTFALVVVTLLAVALVAKFHPRAARVLRLDPRHAARGIVSSFQFPVTSVESTFLSVQEVPSRFAGIAVVGRRGAVGGVGSAHRKRGSDRGGQREVHGGVSLWHDAKTVRVLPAAGANLLPPGGEMTKGREGIAKMWQGVFDVGIATAELKTTEVHAQGPLWLPTRSARTR